MPPVMFGLNKSPKDPGEVDLMLNLPGALSTLLTTFHVCQYFQNVAENCISSAVLHFKWVPGTEAAKCNLALAQQCLRAMCGCVQWKVFAPHAGRTKNTWMGGMCQITPRQHGSRIRLCFPANPEHENLSQNVFSILFSVIAVIWRNDQIWAGKSWAASA